MLKSLRLQPLLAKIAVGYMAKIVVISGIAYVGICEWKETKAREMEVRMINRKKHEINDIYVKMLRLSFFCETFMEWSEQDFLSFQKRRRHIDSLLCSLRYSSSGSHTDSIRNLWRADMEQIVLPAQIFIQILISGIFMRKIAYTDSVFLL